MTTINNQDDFLRALRENPEWKDAVRAQILGEELLKLPIQFNEFKDRMEKFEVRMELFVERQEEFNGRMDRFIERQEETNRNVMARFDRMDARFDRMEGDISTFKGTYAEIVARRQIGLITDDLGFEFVRLMTELELGRIGRQHGPDLATSELRSFRNADLVIEAVDGSETVYIPVEVSFTADHRDSDRAIRNAELLTRFTGRRAVATVASVRNDRHVAGLVESGALQWYEMDQKYLDRITPEPMESL